jgi:hypothetical protein
MSETCNILDRIEAVKRQIFGDDYAGPKRNPPTAKETCGFLHEIIDYAARELTEANTTPLSIYQCSISVQNASTNDPVSGYRLQWNKPNSNETALYANLCLDDIKRRIAVKRGHDLPFDTDEIEGTIPFRLLKHMWGRSSESLVTLAEVVWSKDESGIATAISPAITRVNQFLSKQGCARILSKQDRQVVWVG